MKERTAVLVVVQVVVGMGVASVVAHKSHAKT